jgi:succinoglycan biosynthesis protein ExoW
VIERANGGPGAARNTGLDSLPETTEFVAFLDSDDRWSEDHLASAIAILGNDGDFYFCDHTRWYENDTWFQSSDPIREWMSGDSRLTPNRDDPTTFTFAFGEAVRSFIEDYLAHTSSVVYRFSTHPNIRFDPRLRFAGEDRMFWLDLANASRIVRFSTVPRIHCGRGDNMYLSSIDWDHPDAARRLGNNLILVAAIKQKFKLSGPGREATEVQLKAARSTFAHVWIRKLLKFGVADWPALRAVVRQDPWIFLNLAVAGSGLAWRRIVRGSQSRHGA